MAATRTAVRTGTATIVMIAGLAAPGWAQQAKPFLVFETTAWGDFFADPRDFPLRDALAMAPARIAELPGEVDDFPEEAASVVRMMLHTLSGPSRFAISYDGNNITGGLYGYGMIASVRCEGEKHAGELHSLMQDLAQQALEESDQNLQLGDSTRFPGMRELVLPFGLVSFGPRQSDEGWRYELVLGTMNDPDAIFATPAASINAPGFEPVMHGTLDFSTITPAVKIVSGLAGANAPQLPEIVAQFTEMGLVGPDAMRATFVTGYTAEAMVSRTVVERAAKYADKLMLATGSLDASDLAVVPSDVHAVYVSKGDLRSVEKALDDAREAGAPVDDFINEFKDETGVDFVEDILHAVGGTVVFYNADATGGGSLLSAVMLAKLTDQKTFSATMTKLAAYANGKIGEEGDTRGYVRFDSWADAKAEFVSLHFPGLPVPFEITMGVAGEWFIAAPSPQAAVAAARQALGSGDAGLSSNPSFRSLGDRVSGATSLAFVDPSKTLRSGYPFASLIASGVSNLMRSPSAPGEREPGMILPLYADLAKHAQPAVQITKWEGENLVTTSWADRSAWVRASVGFGAASSVLPLLALGIGAAAASEELNLGLLLEDPTRGVGEFALRSAISGDAGSRAAMLIMLATSNEQPADWLGVLPEGWPVPDDR